MKNLFAKIGFNPKMIINVFIISIIPILIFLSISKKDIILSIPFIIGAMYLPSENLKLKRFEQFLLITLVYVVVTILGSLAVVDSFTGILINFFMIFCVAFLFLSNYKASFYYPIIMYITYLEIFTSSDSKVTVKVLLSVLGVAYMFIFKALLIKKTSKGIIDLMQESNSLNIEQINRLLEGNNFDNNLYRRNKRVLKQINNKAYSLKFRDYLTEALGKIYFNWIVLGGVINTTLSSICEENKEGLDSVTKEFLKDFVSILELSEKYIDKLINTDVVMKQIKDFIEKYNSIDDKYHNIYQLVNILKIIVNIAENNMGAYTEKQGYDIWTLPEEYRFHNRLKRNINMESLKLRFSLRIAIVLTLSLFIVSYFKYPKLFWIPITVIAVAQPFYEDTILKVWVRFQGTIVASIILVIIFNLNIGYDTKIIIGAISVIITLGFIQDDKMIIFATICSVLFASLSMEGYSPIIYRVVYIVIALIIAMTANRYLFPYKIEDAIENHINKLIDIDKNLFKAIIGNLLKEDNLELIRIHVTHIHLIEDKLEFYNTKYKNEGVNGFIKFNMIFVDSLLALLVNYKIIDKYMEKENIKNINSHMEEMLDNIRSKHYSDWEKVKLNITNKTKEERILLDNIYIIKTSIKYLKESYSVIFSH